MMKENRWLKEKLEILEQSLLEYSNQISNPTSKLFSYNSSSSSKLTLIWRGYITQFDSETEVTLSST